MACRDDTERADILEEVQLLQAIYIHELVLEGPVERPSSLTLLLQPSIGDNDQNLKYVCLSLCLKIPAKYPFVIPQISIQNPRGLSDAHINSIQENLFQLAKEKTGSPMLYDLIEYTKDCLSENNLPSCPCVICLEHFHEGTSFTKTNCYHYFHLFCLRKYVDHFLCDNKKILCPMCRLEIERSVQELECDECVSDEEFVYKPDERQQKAQIERQRILEYQRQKGGIINIEEERNKYLIEIKDVKKEATGDKENLDMNLRGENTIIAGKKDESVNDRKGEQRTSRETFKKRERVNRRDNEDQDGKNWVNNRDYQRNRNKTGGNRKRDVVWKESSHEQLRGTKNTNPEIRDCVGRKGSERNHEGRYQDKAKEDMGMASGKGESRDTRRKQENSLNSDKRDYVGRRGSERNHEGQCEDKAKEDMGMISGKGESRDDISSSRKQENSLNPEKRDHVGRRGSERNREGLCEDKAKEDMGMASGKGESRDTRGKQENSLNSDKRDYVGRRGSERNHEGQCEDKAKEDMGMISRKGESRDDISSSRKQENSLNPEKSVKDFERKDRSFQVKPRRQTRHDDEDNEDRKGCKGTSRDKKDYRSLTSPSSGMAGMRNNVSSKSFETKRNDLPCHGTRGVEDSKIPHKNFRKRLARKPREDVKKTPKAPETCLSNTSNISANKNKMEKTESSKAHSRDKGGGSDVKADCRPPPGFAPPPGFEGIAPPPGFKRVAPPPGFSGVLPKSEAL